MIFPQPYSFFQREEDIFKRQMTGRTKEDTADLPFSSATYSGFINRNVANPKLLGFLHDPDQAFSNPAI